jgi:hypothetical protein
MRRYWSLDAPGSVTGGPRTPLPPEGTSSCGGTSHGGSRAHDRPHGCRGDRNASRAKAGLASLLGEHGCDLRRRRCRCRGRGRAPAGGADVQDVPPRCELAPRASKTVVSLLTGSASTHGGPPGQGRRCTPPVYSPPGFFPTRWGWGVISSRRPVSDLSQAGVRVQGSRSDRVAAWPCGRAPACGRPLGRASRGDDPPWCAPPASWRRGPGVWAEPLEEHEAGLLMAGASLVKTNYRVASIAKKRC